MVSHSPLLRAAILTGKGTAGEEVGHALQGTPDDRRGMERRVRHTSGSPCHFLGAADACEGLIVIVNG